MRVCPGITYVPGLTLKQRAETVRPLIAGMSNAELFREPFRFATS